MKCQKCGSELEDGVRFCRECGSKVERQKLFCRECGVKITSGSKFCSNCGANLNTFDGAEIEPPIVSVIPSVVQPVVERIVEETAATKGELPKKPIPTKKAESVTFGDKVSAKVVAFWDSLDIFCRVATVFLMVTAFILLISIFVHKGIATFFSVLQIVGAIVALLMHKEILKPQKRYIKYLVLIAAILLTVLNIRSLSWPAKDNSDTNDATRIEWVNIVLGDVLPEPQSLLVDISLNSEEHLSLYIYEISENEYYEYVRLCKEDYGYTIDSKTIGDSYYAYNSDGYYLNLSYTDYKNADKMHISLDAPKEMMEYEWPDYAVSAGLPKPQSTLGYFNWQYDDNFNLSVGNTSFDDYKAYVDACIEAGFNIDTDKGNEFFYADNSAGYHLGLHYHGFNKMSIDLDCPENILPSTSEETKPDTTALTVNPSLGYIVAALCEVDTVTDIEIGDNQAEIGTVYFTSSLVDKDSFMTSGTWAGGSIDVYSTVDAAVERNEYLDGFWFMDSGSHVVEGSLVIRISANLDDAEQEQLTQDIIDVLTSGEITEDKIAAAMDKYGPQQETEPTTPPTTEASPAETNPPETKPTETTPPETEVTEPKQEPVSYSTNTKDTVRNGNSGIYSYKSRGGAYDIYWIIDFDAGYVYWFTDGNGDTTCDRLKIDSGDLNTYVKITYHDGGSSWSYRLYFKYVEQPTHLIMTDNDGFDYDYYTTDLNKALALRNQKTIIDY